MILVTRQAVLSFNNNIVERAQDVAAESILPGGVLASMTRGMAVKEAARFTDYLNKHGKKFDNLDDAMEGFIKNTHIVDKNGTPIGPRTLAFSNFRENLQRGRLANATQLWQSTLPEGIRKEVTTAIAYRNNITAKLLEEFDLTKMSDAKNFLPTDPKKLTRWRHLNREIYNANVKVASAKAHSNVAPFLRELGKAELKVVLYGAAGGQIAQEYGQDPLIGEILGIIQGGIINPVIEMGRYTKFLSTDAIVKESYDAMLYGTLIAIERLGYGKGKLVSETLNYKDQKNLEKFVNVLTRGDPELLSAVTTRVQALVGSKQDLINAGVSEEVFDLTLAKLTGLSILEAFDSVHAENAISQSKLFSVEGFSTAQATNIIRVGLINELRSLMDGIAPASIDPEKGNILGIWLAKMDNGLKTSEDKVKMMQTNIDIASQNKQIILIDNVINDIKGNKKVIPADIEKAIEEIYLYSGTRIGPNTTLEEAYADSVNLTSVIESSISSEINTLLKNLDNSADKNLMEEDLLKIPKIQRKIKGDEVPIEASIKKSVSTKKITDKIVSQKINALAQVSLEARKAQIKFEGGLPYTNIKKKYPGAEGDATDFFNEIVTLNLDKVSTPLKNLSKRLITPSDLNSLSRSFNAKAKNLIDNNFERSAIIDEMKDLNLDTSQDSYILYHIMNDKNSEFYAPNIRLELDVEDLYNIKSALSKKAFEFSGSKTGIPDPRVNDYMEFQRQLQSIFDNIKDANGNPVPALQKELKEADTYFANEVAPRIYSPNSFFIKFLKSSQSINPEQLFPTGKVYDAKDSEFFNVSFVDEIAKGQTVQDVRQNMLLGFGELDETGKRTVNLSNFKGLRSVLDVRIKQWIHTQRKAKKSINEINDGIRNIEQAFLMEEGKIFSNPNDFIGANGYFSLGEASTRNTKDGKIILSQKNEADNILNKAFDEQIYETKMKLKREKENVEALRSLITKQDGKSGSIGTEEDFFNLLVGRADSQEFLTRLKNNVLENKTMTSEQYDTAVKEIVAKYITDSVYSGTAAKQLKLRKGGTISLFDTDFKKLTELLSKNPTALQNVLGEEHYNVLKSISRYMELEQATNQRQISITGVARALSVESWISRMYSINRDVVSPKYVATEAAIQQFRLRQIKLLKEIIQNPDIAKGFSEMIETGRPLEADKNARFFNSLVLAAGRYAAQSDEYSASDLYAPPADVAKRKVQEKFKTQLEFLGIKTGNNQEDQNEKSIQ